MPTFVNTSFYHFLFLLFLFYDLNLNMLRFVQNTTIHILFQFYTYRVFETTALFGLIYDQ